jgi:hypothetical protein
MIRCGEIIVSSEVQEKAKAKVIKLAKGGPVVLNTLFDQLSFIVDMLDIKIGLNSIIDIYNEIELLAREKYAETQKIAYLDIILSEVCPDGYTYGRSGKNYGFFPDNNSITRESFNNLPSDTVFVLGWDDDDQICGQQSFAFDFHGCQEQRGGNWIWGQTVRKENLLEETKKMINLGFVGQGVIVDYILH